MQGCDKCSKCLRPEVRSGLSKGDEYRADSEKGSRKGHCDEYAMSTLARRFASYTTNGPLEVSLPQRTN